ncbi:sodium- and chloride-dependent glycine transporter 1-like, partial [Acanthaster planci]|uniref:Sodium- and chloride-dependent glycine transporter 1-like n=1 Tax=Acanthaster planci TaxID=133434 RepID=A0A8B8A205_ACAPL
AFLIPYFLSLALAGMPMFFMEVNFGQYCSLGMLTCWRAYPILKGVSYGQFLVAFYMTIAYGVVITYTVYYFFISFTSSLPWVGCGQPWNTPMCSDIVTDCFQAGGVITFDNECVALTNLTEFELDDLNITTSGPGNFSLANYIDPWKAMRKSPSEEYWMYVCNEFACSAQVWLDAVVQIFYSLTLAMGGMQTLASYNKFHNNTYRDTMIVTILNSATSILAGFVIFSILGYMAHVQGKDVSEVARQGFGLAFVAYPEVVARMPAAPFWSVLFFFMLITLGLDSQ